ncbi:MAG: regulatory protein RecX [Bowdeniella nasicola]|nr:regulatory protein RecX [Bowdeniella nasicola]
MGEYQVPGVDEDWPAIEAARTIALNRLDRAPATRSQVREAMLKRDVEADVADRVLDRLEAVGLIDDAAYAAALVRTRHRERQLARRAIAHELAAKGITGTTAEAALAQIDAEDELEAARAVVAKKLRLASMARVPRATRQRRLAGVLGRKGFDAEITYRVIREALSDS